MSAELVLLALALGIAALLAWGFRVLPRERWQILATVPVIKTADGNWRGVNLTYYGLLSATAYAVAVLVLLVLTAATGASPAAVAAAGTVLLAACVPASRWMARVIERKPCTFTVAGAFCVGLVLAPPVVALGDLLWRGSAGAGLPLMPTLAAFAIAYAVGEGVGRLACVSFGCCYGKPIEAVPAHLRRLFSRFHFVFVGATKKIAYASGLEGAKVVPVQALTAIVYVGAALIAALMFLGSRYEAAFVTAIAATQTWRALSECLRADHRGDGRVSAYQLMAIGSVLYALAFAVLVDAPGAPAADAGRGLAALWDPLVVLFTQAVWATIFVYTGRSEVTEASVAIHVCQSRT